MTKASCKECLFWQKVTGTKKHKNEQGLCAFMNSRVYTVWQDNDLDVDENNRSLVITHSSEIDININGLYISSNSKQHIMRHTWVHTDAGFYCAEFTQRT